MSEQTVWRYGIPPEGKVTHRVPPDSQIVLAAWQREIQGVCLWMLVDPDVPEHEWEEREFSLFGNGGVFKGNYCGSAMDSLGMVLHVVETT